jgi:SAM-dependent methyltransferase
MAVREYVYDNRYYDEGIGGFHQWSFPEISRRFVELAGGHRFGAVLDFGCGNGFYSRFLRDHARRLDGVDFSTAIEENPNRARYDQVFRADLGKPWSPGCAYDALFSIETIEHVEDWEQFLQNAYGALGPGGTLFLTTTTYFFTVFILLVVYRRKVTPAALAEFARGLMGDEAARTRFVMRFWDYLTGHYHGFSRSQLERGLRSAGFVVDRIDNLQVQPVVPVNYFDQPYNGPAHYRVVVDAWVPFLRLTGRAINRVTRDLDLYAPNVVAVARKPG